MSLTLAFDVYGTLIDTHGVVQALQGHVGEEARRFSQRWRDKQLEYSFRRGLMQRYDDFAVCTRQALEYTCQSFKRPLSDEVKDMLMASYRTLPAFDDVQQGLARAKADGHRVYAFSNGSAKAVDELLDHAGLCDWVDGTVSVEGVRSFKPDPAVYAHFLKETDSAAEATWLVSSNPFDVIGARSAGWQAFWLQRDPNAVFDPWEFVPTETITSLTDVAACLKTA